MPWRTVHVVEASVSREFAWRFWTNVANWALDPAIESVSLDGAFECGAHGETTLKEGDPVRWMVVEVEPGAGAVIEVRAPGAVARFRWQFDELAPERTRVRQEITLEGPAGNQQAKSLGADFEQGVQEGMRRLAVAMEREASSSHD